SEPSAGGRWSRWDPLATEVQGCVVWGHRGGGRPARAYGSDVLAVRSGESQACAARKGAVRVPVGRVVRYSASERGAGPRSGGPRRYRFRRLEWRGVAKRPWRGCKTRCASAWRAVSGEAGSPRLAEGPG